jgi:hypothetical protein
VPAAENGACQVLPEAIHIDEAYCVEQRKLTEQRAGMAVVPLVVIGRRAGRT